MIRSSLESGEKALAMLLVLGCALAIVLTRTAGDAAEQRLANRVLQLEQLAAMQASGHRSDADPRVLDGLFANATLRWHRGPAATFLQLRPERGENP